MKLYRIFPILLILLTGCFSLGAQVSVRLDEAIQIALNNNGMLRAETKTVEYRQALVKTAYTLDPTQINGEFGQFNSAYFDSGFGVSQSFALPGVYKKRAMANHQSVKSAEAGVKLAEADIKQQVHEHFAEYNYLEATERLLHYQDSLYDGFLQKATLRWQQGETDQLEKTTAEQQKINISGQLASVASMKMYLLLSLDRLLNDGRRFVPDMDSFAIIPLPISGGQPNLMNHPAIQMAAGDIETAKAWTASEKTALLPQFNVGYRNVGIRGTGADNVVYGVADRFSSFQVGVGFPLFRKGYQAAVKAAQIQEEVKTRVFETVKNDVETRIQQQYILYQQTMTQIEQYTRVSLPNARTIRGVSEKKFAAGDINYLEFVLLTNQAIQIETDYLALIRKANACIINLYFLTQPE